MTALLRKILGGLWLAIAYVVSAVICLLLLLFAIFFFLVEGPAFMHY